MRKSVAAGGLDFLIGDGQLNYAPEYVWESFYSSRLFPGFYATFDMQRDTNPAYNHDRGPVIIYSIRLHVGLGLRPCSGNRCDLRKNALLNARGKDNYFK